MITYVHLEKQYCTNQTPLDHLYHASFMFVVYKEE